MARYNLSASPVKVVGIMSINVRNADMKGCPLTRNAESLTDDDQEDFREEVTL